MIGFSSGVLECFAFLAGGAAQGEGDAAGKSEKLPVFRINGEKSQRTPGFFLDIETMKKNHQNQCAMKDLWYFANLPRKMMFRKTSFS